MRILNNLNISNILNNLNILDLDWGKFDEQERLRIGNEAEQHVHRIISGHGEGVLLRGPLVPQFKNNQIQGYRETDFLVYTQGSLFCVEVKNFSGTITYRPMEARDPSAVLQPPRYNDSWIVQTKSGKRGEVFREEYPNPLKRTVNFIGLLKRYMTLIEPRFRRLYIWPVVCFGSKADISAIYNFQTGIIQIEQLGAFFDQHRNAKFADRPLPWVTHTILYKVPNWDRILLLNGEWANGVFTTDFLVITGVDGRPYSLAAYAYMREIAVWRMPRGLLKLVITFMGGETQVVDCRDGEFQMRRGPEVESYRLRNVQRIVIGLENKLARTI